MNKKILSFLILFMLCIVSFASTNQAEEWKKEKLLFETESSGDFFTLIQIPDTQSWANGNGEIANFINTANWIIDNTTTWNIFFTVHVGDIVATGTSDTEWNRAEVFFSALNDSNIPFLAVPGNHDDDATGFSDCPDCSLNKYHTYLPTSRMANNINSSNISMSGTNYVFGGANGSDESGQMDWSYYATFDIESNGKTYPFIVIGYRWCPSDNDLAWVNDTLNTYSNRNAILFTHSNMDTNNTWLYPGDDRACNGKVPERDLCDGSPASCNCNDGNQQWNEMIKYHPNVCLVLSGHVSDYEVGEYGSTGHGTFYIPAEYQNIDFDNKVHAILANYQSHYDSGYYGGAFRQYKFYLEDGWINVTTFSTDTTESESENGWYNESNNKFNLTYNFTSSGDTTLRFLSIENGTNGTVIYTSTPTINWSIDTQTAQYWLQIDDNADFSSPEVNITDINQYNYPSNCIIGTNVSFTIPILNKLTSYGTYYMKVKSFN